METAGLDVPDVGEPAADAYVYQHLMPRSGISIVAQPEFFRLE
jgi:hypothetical protein